MIDPTMVELSRLQFALTAMVHFLFVPLTLGLSVILAMMESVYVLTGKMIWRQMTQFWGTLFGINFAMGVATGIVMEFEFGTNWAYYSHYVGDIFGAPLAIEGLMAFFLEASFIGLFFFGWDRLTKLGHLAATWAVAIGSNLSALWILIANGWMQNPVGAVLNPDTLRMEMTSFYDLVFNPVAQAKFVHTVSAGYVTGAMFVLGVSAYYLLRGRHQDLARRSMAVAAAFGLASALSVVVLGDESGYTATHNQKMKLAAIEAMWDTHPAPAPFTLFGLPDQDSGQVRAEIQIPAVLGLIATRSLDQTIPGIRHLVTEAEGRIRNGLPALAALETLAVDRGNQAARAQFHAHGQDLGYALLLRQVTNDPVQASDAQIRRAAELTVPQVAPLFWAFRGMVGLGFYFILFFAVTFFLSARGRLDSSRLVLRLAVLSIPLPWLAAELGWFVAEYGRQPWVIEGVLPTAAGVSSLTTGTVLASLIAFTLLYSVLVAVELFLLTKTIRRGPVQPLGEPPVAPKAPPPIRLAGGCASR